MANVTYYGRGLPEWAKVELETILDKCEIPSCTVTSAKRTIQEQAVAMYNLIVAKGVKAAMDLYKNPGDKVIQAYEKAKKENMEKDLILAEMGLEISRQGPSKVSNHCSEDPELAVFDLSRKSLPKGAKFKNFITGIRESKFFESGIDSEKDPAIHVEWYHLKNCPFCDGEPEHKGYGITCTKCGLWYGESFTEYTRSTGLTLAQRWNTRVK